MPSIHAQDDARLTARCIKHIEAVGFTVSKSASAYWLPPADLATITGVRINSLSRMLRRKDPSRPAFYWSGSPARISHILVTPTLLRWIASRKGNCTKAITKSTHARI